MQMLQRYSEQKLIEIVIVFVDLITNDKLLTDIVPLNITHT